MIEEFPREEHITARVSGKTKRKLKTLPYSYAEVLTIGADYLSKEINLLEYEKGELEIDIAGLRKEIAKKEEELHNINNRIRIVNPRKLDKETLESLINDTALDYAQEIFDAHGVDSVERIERRMGKRSIFSKAEEWGYDQGKFMKLVRLHVQNLCNTD